MSAPDILALFLALAFAALGLAKVLALPDMRRRAGHAGLSVTAYRRIGALELLAAAGLAVGFDRPVVGTAAATGLAILLVGALATHVRIGDGWKEAAPALAMELLTLAYLALTVGAS